MDFNKLTKRVPDSLKEYRIMLTRAAKPNQYVVKIIGLLNDIKQDICNSEGDEKIEKQNNLAKFAFFTKGYLIYFGITDPFNLILSKINSYKNKSEIAEGLLEIANSFSSKYLMTGANVYEALKVFIPIVYSKALLQATNDPQLLAAFEDGKNAFIEAFDKCNEPAKLSKATGYLTQLFVFVELSIKLRKGDIDISNSDWLREFINTYKSVLPPSQIVVLQEIANMASKTKKLQEIRHNEIFNEYKEELFSVSVAMDSVKECISKYLEIKTSLTETEIEVIEGIFHNPLVEEYYNECYQEYIEELSADTKVTQVNQTQVAEFRLPDDYFSITDMGDKKEYIGDLVEEAQDVGKFEAFIKKLIQLELITAEDAHDFAYRMTGIKIEGVKYKNGKIHWNEEKGNSILYITHHLCKLDALSKTKDLFEANFPNNLSKAWRANATNDIGSIISITFGIKSKETKKDNK